ncbi:MAG TPA: DNA repair exonuclease [Acidimicrobiales bacterium]|nr:DNA repair exonuclease [Acidimicrobiales bacterium]
MAKAARSGEFCFVHAADLHLDTPFTGLSHTAPHVGAALREASLEAFDHLVQLCLDRGAAFLLLAGDVYDGPERGLRAQFRLKAGLERLAAAGIDTLVVHGNHDPVGEGWSALGSLPERVHVFPPGQVSAVTLERDGEALATVQGVSYEQRVVTENLALRFAQQAGPGLQIGLLHCNVAGAPDGHASYSPCTLGDLHRIGLDYWALGHVHTATVMSGEPFANTPFVVYPGTLQARSPKPSERGPKGAAVVSVQGGRVASLEMVACDVVRFEELEIDVSASPTVEAVHDAVTAAASAVLTRIEGRALVARARLIGRSPAHPALARSGVREALVEQLREDWSLAEPFVWWDRLIDDSRPDLDLEAARSAGDFVADLLQQALELGGSQAPGLPLPAASVLDATVLDDLLGKMPTELRSRAVTMLEQEITVAELLESATWTALDLLEADT